MLKEIYEKYVLKYYKILIAVGVILVLSTIGFVIISHSTYSSKEKEDFSTNDLVIEDTKEVLDVEKQETYYYVDIKGSITNPNIYQVEEGSRIADVIKMAGGLTDQADTGVLNLSKKVNDEMVIIIYTKDEIAKFKDGGETIQEVIKYIETDCECPDPAINGACIDNKVTQSESGIASKISLNAATKDELMTLSGIGDAKAQDIIDYRTSNGEFKSIEDIKNITGIGDSIFDKIKDYITL